ncbi:LTXXQ domain protein (plasmid) [Pseudomonas silesiensis]|uniref:LTXXQ domain protein n=1 Tax=Pseudomonas silesiensis TaxID=1853130 RepID=UPI0030D5C382
MKKLLLALALTMAVPSLALAAPSADSQGGPGSSDLIRLAQQELGLSDEQTTILRDATQEEKRAHYEITMRYLNRLSDNDKASMKQDHLDAAKKRQTKVTSMLTPEQQTKAANAFLKQKAEMEKVKALTDNQ